MKNNLHANIVSIVSNVAKIPQEAISEDENLYTLGVDSLMALEIVARIEKYYQIEVPEEEIARVKTLRDILNAVSARLCLTV